MIKNIWKSFRRYIKVSRRESQLALFFGVRGALLETFSIFVLANLITNLDNNSSTIQFNVFNQNYISREIFILTFLISSIVSASFYYLSNKNIVKAKSCIEKFIREEITDITLNIKWEYYLKMSQGDISKSIISEGQNISEGYMYFCLLLHILLLHLLILLPV